MATSNPTRQRKTLQQQIIQNFHLVWLDGNFDENNNDCRNSITQLQQIVNTVNTFVDVDECIDFITNIQEETIFMISSDVLSQITATVIHNTPQVSNIYIVSENKARHEQWAEEWPKVKGVFTDLKHICEALINAAQDCDQNAVSISVMNKNTLDCSFMYTQILKDILLTIKFDDGHIIDFLTYSREVLAGNEKELKNVDKIQKEYRDHQPIWWYTYQSYLYSILNKALRLMEVNAILKLAFFLCDLHNDIKEIHSKQINEHTFSKSFVVYRGQNLSKTDFDQMKQNQGGLLAFNNFLSTSTERNVSMRFLNRNLGKIDMINVLFVMCIDSSIDSTPFANIKDVSYYKREEEVLFSMHSVFRIGQIKKLVDTNEIWEVELTLTSDNGSELRALTERMQKETYSYTGWHRLGKLLIKLAQYDKAKELSELLLKQTNDQGEKQHIYHMLGMINNGQGKYAEAVEYYEKSVKIKEIISQNSLDLAGSYNNIGSVYTNMDEYSKALEYYGKSLEICRKTLPENHPDLASSYNNIGLVYDKMGEYSKALEYYGKSLEIRKKTLPENHPDLATSYNNMGMVYNNMGEYSKALEYYGKSLGICRKTLPENHPLLATSYNNIGSVYDNMGEYSKALEYYGKSLEICRKTLPENHPDLASSYNNIGLVYDKMGEYSKALEYYGKSLEIRKKTLPENHPDLATSYNNMGMVYNNMGEYSKALEYYGKSLGICRKTLPENHPLLATSYNNIGSVYDNMGEYSKALEYYGKSLEICRKTLPENHPDLASSYNNIGLVYDKMGEYSKALEYYGKSLEIRKKTLPENHPDLATSYNNMGMVYNNMGEYSKALEYYGKSLGICRKTLPENHPLLATSYNNIGSVYDNMGEYSKALEYYGKSLEIRKRTLPENHPDFATSYNNIAIVCYNMTDYKKALEYFQRALDIWTRSLPPNHANIKTVKQSIEIMKRKV